MMSNPLQNISKTAFDTLPTNIAVYVLFDTLPTNIAVYVLFHLRTLVIMQF